LPKICQKSGQADLIAKSMLLALFLISSSKDSNAEPSGCACPHDQDLCNDVRA
jgi:hypothetical protein